MDPSADFFVHDETRLPRAVHDDETRLPRAVHDDETRLSSTVLEVS